MFESIKRDFHTNESVVSKLIIIVYRFGNFIYYRFNVPVLKKIFWIIYRIIDFIFRFFTHCEIPAKAIIGSGLRIDHNGNGIVIHPDVRMGKNCRIFHQVTIGVDSFATGESYGVATIGNNCYIGAGAKIIGKLNIGNNVRVGANAVVIKDALDNKTLVGVPARNL
ncbi:serine O-acetyltransferase [Enterococcus sp. 5H]|uniref:serine O-acetyltransferase n=1 Tax=Enterococcus sp. 5H TaxID=1229490 RepID=UPI0023029BBD|nr:serine acetyltransferase [Enterococcus sp. 5H]